MKKTLLLVAALVGVVGAKAQTESWSVNNSDGTLKDVYVANPDIHRCRWSSSRRQMSRERMFLVL